MWFQVSAGLSAAPIEDAPPRYERSVRHGSERGYVARLCQSDPRTSGGKLKRECVPMRTDIHLHLLYDCRLLEEAGRVNQLLPTWEDPDGNYIDRSSRFVFARRWGLGILPLARLTSASRASRRTRSRVSDS